MALQTAVEDADQPVAEGPEGSVMGVTSRTSSVVEGSGAWRGVSGSEGPHVNRIGQAAVAGVTGEDHPLGARRPGDGRRAGVILARLGGAVAVRFITELAQHPGAEDGPQSWQGSDHLGIRMLFKSRF